MAAIAVQDASDGLTDITFTAATGGGDTIVGGFKAGGWSRPVVLLVKNAGWPNEIAAEGAVPSL